MPIPTSIQSFIDRQADAATVSYADLRAVIFNTWNILHYARVLKDAGGIPADGNSTHDWNLSDPEHPNPEYR